MVASWLVPPHTHDLQLLWRELVAVGYAIGPIEADCTLLKPYAVLVRHPGFGSLNDLDAIEALTAADKVRAAVTGALAV